MKGVVAEHYSLTVHKKKFEDKAVKNSQNNKELRIEINGQECEIVTKGLKVSMTEKDEVKDNLVKKIEEPEENVINLSQVNSTKSWILLLHQSGIPHPKISLVKAFLVLQMT
jgi:hypothetical protein